MNPRPRERKGRRGGIADRLRAARTIRGLTQEQAAKDLGVGRATLAQWESGIRVPKRIALLYLEKWCADSKGAKRKGGTDGSRA